MCGIAGIIQFQSELDSHSEREISTMLEHTRRRGPDASSSIAVSKKVLLGSNRLAISDPHNTQADMPYQIAERELSVVFNGEIYNYRELRDLLQAKHCFKTQCDTEVLLAAYLAWGESFLERLEGMFSFCIYDGRKRRALLGVDPAGQKPLYYSNRDGRFIFCSDLEAILKTRHEFQLDYSAISEIIALRYTLGSNTHIKEISRLEPGKMLSLDEQGNFKLKQYYSLPLSADKTSDPAEAAELIRIAFERSCQNVMTCDLPISLLLSGGLDSASILALAVENDLDIETFSIGFEQLPSVQQFEDDWYADEFEYTQFLIDKYYLKNTKIRFGVDEYFDYAEKWFSQMGEPYPFTDGVALLRIFEEVSKRYKVAISGTGADELFDGYLIDKEKRVSYGQHMSQVCKNVSELPAIYVRSFLRLHACDINELLPQREVTYSLEEKISEIIEPYRAQTDSIYDLCQAVLLYGNCIKYEYTQVDQTSMYSSVEARNPFAEKALLKAGFAIDPSLRNKENTEKWIFREAMKGLVPDKIRTRKKGAFPMPLEYFFTERYEEMIQPMLTGNSFLKESGLFGMKYIQQLWNSPNTATRPVFWRLLAVERVIQKQKPLLKRAEGALS